MIRNIDTNVGSLFDFLENMLSSAKTRSNSPENYTERRARGEWQDLRTKVFLMWQMLLLQPRNLDSDGNSNLILMLARVRHLHLLKLKAPGQIGFGLVSRDNGDPLVHMTVGSMDIKKYIVSGSEIDIRKPRIL